MKTTVTLFGLAALSSTLLGCDNDAPKPPTTLNERSQGVQAAPGTQAPSVATTAAASTAAPAPKKPRAPLCEGQLDRPGKPLPKFMPRPVAASGAAAPVIPSQGRWTWINLWAAWCKPCKEEIPLLKSWESALAGKLQLTFFSLDDDKRQLDDFMTNQPASGLKSTFWLQEGAERDKWLLEAGVGTDPDLPVHVLVDPKGQVRCVVRGAIEESDLVSVKSIVGG
jgi:thiol-disulfide isomerase/thioredoxin